jgi:hypothetical protein
MSDHRRPAGTRVARCWVTLGVALAVALAVVPLAGAAETVASHCSAHEQTLFNCGTGSKTVSVCATLDLSAAAGSVQYRFGPVGAPELVYPPAAGWRAQTRGAVLTFAGGGGAYLAFTNGPYRYVVYTAIGRGWGEKAGVAVEKSGKRMASLPCKGKETSELGPDLFVKAGIAEDTAGFDPP